jgi:hypothetical protein
VDHLPKLIGRFRLISIIVNVVHRELRSEQEITDGVLVKDTVNQDPLSMALEVDPVIPATEAVECAPVTLDSIKTGSIQRVEVFGQNLKFSKQVELKVLG